MQVIDFIISSVLELYPTPKYTIERTSDNSIFFTIVLFDNFELHIDLFIDSIGKDKELFYYLYKNKFCILLRWTNIQTLINLINDKNLLQCLFRIY